MMSAIASTSDSPTADIARQIDRILNTEIEPVIQRYFETLNAGNFQATAALFAPNGALHPPFENLVIGEEAIATYLNQEAQGIKLYPRCITNRTAIENDLVQVTVSGHVKTAWFSVNVAWKFVLNPAQEIVYVAIELLATLQELANLRR
ncbi:ketosteroid isomerase family protein [Tumidithrix elongata RA019]|uniref:Ketosteroid isomerase family protein n=1 Tax=Tumidithrix elongata BACA0141 TaxID=2716417 RepID=A0AAW9PX61_9CYAN|nr:ketosteroid isomerase family protein [Tumidithrix elongata RA019]